MNYGMPPDDGTTAMLVDGYAPEPGPEYGPPASGGGGFTLAQAQWLIRFMRNLPGGAPAEPTDAEYQAAVEAQRQQALAMNGAYSAYDAYDYDDDE
jgi:hypothetical protein